MSMVLACCLLTEKRHKVRAGHLRNTVSVKRGSNPREWTAIRAIQISLTENITELGPTPGLHDHMDICKGDKSATGLFLQPLRDHMNGLRHSDQTDWRIQYLECLHASFCVSWLLAMTTSGRFAGYNRFRRSTNTTGARTTSLVVVLGTSLFHRPSLTEQSMAML